jgi:hypothetical protein
MTRAAKNLGQNEQGDESEQPLLGPKNSLMKNGKRTIADTAPEAKMARLTTSHAIMHQSTSLLRNMRAPSFLEK